MLLMLFFGLVGGFVSAQQVCVIIFNQVKSLCELWTIQGVACFDVVCFGIACFGMTCFGTACFGVV